MTRAWLVLVHRYVGLVLAGFLLLAGITGALLVWYPELDAAVNPRWMRIAPPTTGHASQRLSPLELRERVQQAYPKAWVHWVPLREGQPHEAVSFWIEGAADATGQHVDLDVNEVFINPYTGAILGARMWGDITRGWGNLMPFIHRLHHSLALGTMGTQAFGIVALLWTLDCFIGAWLTLPTRPRHRRETTGVLGWVSRWAPAWKLRWRGNLHKLSFDLHRAGGLWPWAALLVLAWSSVAFNLYNPVYKPITQALLDMTPDPRETLPRHKGGPANPALGWPAALAATRHHMATVASQKGLQLRGEERFSYDAHKNLVRLEVTSNRDVSERRGRTAVFVDASTGQLLATRLPTGEAAGDTVTTWLLTLHMAHLWGTPFRVAMTLLGTIVALLSVTGMWIWWRKRTARRANRVA